MQKIEKSTLCFFTQQVFLIGTKNEDGAPRFVRISWVSYTGGRPGCLVISMNGIKHTKDNVTRTGILSETVVTPGLLPSVEACGTSEEEDKPSEYPEFYCRGAFGQNVGIYEIARHSAIHNEFCKNISQGPRIT